MVKLLSDCCCRVPLRWGTLLVGIVYLSAYAGVACLWSYSLYHFDHLALDQVPDSPRSREIIFILLGMVVIYACMHIAANVTLIYGTIKERISMIKAWIIFYAISLPIQNLFIMFDLIFQNKQILLGDSLFGIVLAYFLSLFFQVYFMWVVYSHYRTLRDESRDDNIEVLNFLQEKQFLSRPDY